MKTATQLSRFTDSLVTVQCARGKNTLTVALHLNF